ncbi:carbamoyltransferase C-terminal domain-containing protein, partial [Pseudomonas sp. NPDC086278]|uniref:carbamoyltransferase C-terminal domain-containing protein n=1 Tax=Pseudomonas sp. NPDC086278 TaxID=3390646 RepID=UPI003D07CC44
RCADAAFAEKYRSGLLAGQAILCAGLSSPGVAEEWKTRVPEVVHEDGTSRAQVLKREYNPRYYDMMKALEVLTGNGVSLNTSLNRRGEPMICSPTDALNMFFGSDLQYLIMEDILVVKEGADAYDTLG